MSLSPSAKRIAALLAATLCLLAGAVAVWKFTSTRTPLIAQQTAAPQPSGQPITDQQSATEHKGDFLPRASARHNEQASMSEQPAAVAPAPQASTQAPQQEPPQQAALQSEPAPKADVKPEAPAPGGQASVSAPPPVIAGTPAPSAAQQSPVATPGAPPVAETPPQPAANTEIATGALPPQILSPGTPIPAPRPAAASGEMQLASLPPMQYAPDAPIPLPRPATGAIELPKERGKDAKDAKSANVIFSTLALPNASSPHSIGEYNKGCVSGAAALPLVGEHWQVMRPARNRNWGHPTLVDFIERLAGRVSKATGWGGILIGDMSQPRGGPLPFGHASHQIGLDVDIWLKPMPKEPFADADREKEEAVSVLAADRKHVDPKIWLDGDAALVKLAAEEPQVERVFANAAIKQELCTNPQTKGASWLTKVRPWWGHDEHVHVRLKCQPGSASCKDQAPIPAGDGCGKALDSWFKPGVLAWRPPPDGTTLRKPMPMAALPAECTSVAKAPAGTNLARQ